MTPCVCGNHSIFICRNFQYPYVVFLPIVSQNGGRFPTNAAIKDIQGGSFTESSKYIASFHFSTTYVSQDSWKGDIVVAKYWDHAFGTIMDCAMSDYPMIIMSFSLPLIRE